MADPPTDPEGEGGRRRGLVGGMIGRVAPAVMRQIDMDAVVEQLDVNAIAEQLDLDAIMARLDMDALVERLDVNLVAEKLDLDALMARLDMDLLVERLDVNLVAEKLDLDALMTRLDMDLLVERLDVNLVAEQLDIDAVMARVDMAQLTASATQDVAVSGLDLARRQLVRADATVDGVFDRVLRRRPGDRPVAPSQLVRESEAGRTDDDTADGGDTAVPEIEPAELQRLDVSGHYAGPVTRLLTLAGDVAAAIGSFGFVSAVTLYLLSLFFGLEVTLGSGGWASRALLAAWWLLWFWAPVALFGRTLVMALTGLAVVRRDGGLVNGRRAFVRALVMPFSMLILFIGLVGMVLGRERRTLHDVAAGTAVVYDWGARQAERPVSIRDQLSTRVRRRQQADTR